MLCGLSNAEDRIRRYFRRRKTYQAAVESKPDDEARTPAAITYSTPSPAPQSEATYPEDSRVPAPLRILPRREILPIRGNDGEALRLAEDVHESWNNVPGVDSEGGYHMDRDDLLRLLSLDPVEVTQLTPPDSLLPAENIFRLITGYYLGYYFDSTKWLDWSGQGSAWREGATFLSRSSKCYSYVNPISYDDDMSAAAKLFNAGKENRAKRQINQAFENFDILLHEQHPQLMACMFSWISELDSLGAMDLLQLVLEKIYSVATASEVFGPSHMFSRLNCWLARAS
jgi:hypothetical protein